MSVSRDEIAVAATMNPVRVDIVGDFAGQGLFAIHGEALLGHCIRHARVDFGAGGFQLLHAVHAFEDFLAKLTARGCNFQIVWFEMPKYVLEDDSTASKFQLARSVLIEHLRKLRPSDGSNLFSSPGSDAFGEYLHEHSLSFFLGERVSGLSEDTQTVTQQMLSAGYCVAFLEDVEIRSSKIYTSVVSPTVPRGVPAASKDDDGSIRQASTESLDVVDALLALPKSDALTAREILCLSAFSQVLGDAKDSLLQEASALIIHLVLLRHIPLSHRGRVSDSSDQTTSTDPLGSFFDTFAEKVRGTLAGWATGKYSDKKWDAFDLLDGRLYTDTFHRLGRVTADTLGSQLTEEVNDLSALLSSLSKVELDVLSIAKSGPTSQTTSENLDEAATPSAKPSVLPFSNPVMDLYLSEVKLEARSDENRAPAPKVFQELTHWHNSKKPIDPKYVPKPLDKKALRKNQRFMAETIAYSASLTGESGKNIDPEIIVVSATTSQKPSTNDARNKNTKPPPVKKTKAGATIKSGTQKAVEEAQRMQAEKSRLKSRDVTQNWNKLVPGFEKEESLVKRYLSAEKYLRELSAAHTDFIASEVLLYLCSILVRIANQREVADASYLSIMAMIWSKVKQICSLGLTQPVFDSLATLAKTVKFPVSAIDRAGLALRPSPLPFKVQDPKYPIPQSATRFQLEYAGPYMDRGFDSAADDRVPFVPDAWQREVLDAIDDHVSVLAIAPTSAGKTFISFYAMKKILQSNDDDILVYVAPTKALVNQIAAEVQARFSKKYRQDARSIWSIHTRDYRINNPKGCQVLVTVPSILQIMLLSPANSSTPTAWARRIKWIIFDEVHCIGQSDEGMIWEQLLLMAPCPIIALSATVGNPEDFKDWLEKVQQAKGFKFKMVVHTSRYSDLRKFIHAPPESKSEFKGLTAVERLPVPGLDSETKAVTPFYFVHPVSGIVESNPDILSDVSLEPRDCLMLWDSMVHTQKQIGGDVKPPAEIPLKSPVKRSDVVSWESELKNQLASWMRGSATPFQKVRDELRGTRYSELSNDQPPSTMTLDSKSGATVSSRSVFSLLLDLRASGALPAILFNYDRTQCEVIAHQVLVVLQAAEETYRNTNKAWIRKMDQYAVWKKAQEAKGKVASKVSKKSKGRDDDDKVSKADQERDSSDPAYWASFDPEAPIQDFSFADRTKLSTEELDQLIDSLKWAGLPEYLIHALQRGVGVHHAGMNRKYRQVVEMLFRKGFLTVVVATGTLAMGINMPCKTVVFTGDSVYLTSLNYRQASGRAGRRGFDLLGNVVFHNIHPHRVFEIMSAKLPDLRGQFPLSVTLVLRLLTLLHGTKNSDYASNMIAGLLTQSRMYMGGPDDRMSIAHHVRFSIEYLRRQHLLSETGAPLNFAGLVGHLYYTENAVFALHSLLRGGFFHRLCTDIDSDSETKQKDILNEIVLVLSHLFCRYPCHQYQDKAWLEEHVHRSSSMVILPDLPAEAEDILTNHNKETLDIFRGYVSSYVEQHLAETPDNELPFTKTSVGAPGAESPELAKVLGALGVDSAPTKIRSPFAALSGFKDNNFGTIKELCETVRSGVFLEDSAIPYIPIAPRETNGVPWNAYLYDFFRHGDQVVLVKDNGVRKADLWFHLKDFSLILATIVTSLGNYLDPSAAVDADDEVADESRYERAEVKEDKEEELKAEAAVKQPVALDTAKKVVVKKAKKVVADSWDDGDDSEGDSDAWDAGSDTAGGKGSEPVFSAADTEGQSLIKVHKAFQMVQAQFDEKFFKMWA
ncbi:hypothetical protein QBC35DRAFT_493254 [Podospora australis]|uniref:Helicase n=1 Tax=Podospora australis TaxID=1536484 RepID=A0AAN7AKJ6_9PEZI|nr:hypothetical protein QBC35DRAFT_493254 [Podospora australis]